MALEIEPSMAAIASRCEGSRNLVLKWMRASIFAFGLSALVVCSSLVGLGLPGQARAAMAGQVVGQCNHPGDCNREQAYADCQRQDDEMAALLTSGGIYGIKKYCNNGGPAPSVYQPYVQGANGYAVGDTDSYYSECPSGRGWDELSHTCLNSPKGLGVPSSTCATSCSSTGE